MPAVTITYLEMLSPGTLIPRHTAAPDFSVREAAVPQGAFNKFLYTTVGAAWSWTDKLGWSDAQWQAHAADPALRTFVAWHGGSPAGYYELYQHPDPALGIEIGIYGLLPAFYGRGYGAALLTSAIEQAWAMHPNRVWVHTCTDDHPAALPNYQASGFTIYHTETHLKPPAS